MGILVTLCGYWASIHHKICSAHILASPLIDGKGSPSIDIPFVPSTALSRETDWPLLSKTCITSDLTVGLTSNWWHWKANSKLYLVSNDELNRTKKRSPSISKHLTFLCSSAPQKAPKDTKITYFLQIIPEPVNTLNRLYIVVNIS